MTRNIPCFLIVMLAVAVVGSGCVSSYYYKQQPETIMTEPCELHTYLYQYKRFGEEGWYAIRYFEPEEGDAEDAQFMFVVRFPLSGSCSQESVPDINRVEVQWEQLLKPVFLERHSDTVVSAEYGSFAGSDVRVTWFGPFDIPGRIPSEVLVTMEVVGNAESSTTEPLYQEVQVVAKRASKSFLMDFLDGR